MPANTAHHYRFTLPNVDYTFGRGHRIMVQLQSTLFPLYDRNAQSWVADPFAAKPADMKVATVTVLHGGADASAVWLPVVH